MINIDQVKRLEQPLLVKLIDDGQLILETDLLIVWKAHSFRCGMDST